VFDAAIWAEAVAPDLSMLIMLTSIHWRESWKYGERAFRYCQHDLGHAIAALSISAALDDRQVVMLPEWSHGDIAALSGIDRDQDFIEAEREEPGCILAVAGRQSSVVSLSRQSESSGVRRDALLAAVRGGTWTGRASQLSEEHVQWTFIDDIARATEDRGRALPRTSLTPRAAKGERSATPHLILQRRSALAFDGRSSVDADRFFTMLAQAVPADRAPWDALWWTPRIHLALFVHRVDGLAPGLYLLARSESGMDRLRTACKPDFAWGRAHDTLPLFVLAHGDCRSLAQRVSCDQEIAGDGFFSLGMLADFDDSLREFGDSFYRHLFWESGVVGQALYLAAEAAGARGTGIGCFYDDPVHDVLGLSGHTFQTLYHFTIGAHVEDTRLTTAPGYAWESTTGFRP